MRKRKQQNPRERFKSYSEWMGDDNKRDELKKWLEKAGIPLELRTIKILEEQGYRCSSYHYKDPESGKYREIDIHAFNTNVTSFNVGNCQVVFNVLILAECKYSHYFDFLAFESKEKYFPAFPVIFVGNGLLGASYQDFEFPMIIRKIAETDVRNLELSENFQDRKTHRACEKLTSCFSQMYERRKKMINVNFDQYRLRFGPSWKNFLGKTHPIREKRILQQKIGEFLKKNFKPQELLRQIPYFSVQIGFPIIIIPEERGLIRIKHDITTGQIIDFENVGYGIYPYISENADRYGNVLREYFAFPIVICNFAYLEECLKTLNKGIEKMMTDARTRFSNNPYAIAEEVMERIYEKKLIGNPPLS